MSKLTLLEGRKKIGVELGPKYGRDIVYLLAMTQAIPNTFISGDQMYEHVKDLLERGIMYQNKIGSIRKTKDSSGYQVYVRENFYTFQMFFEDALRILNKVEEK